MEHLQFDKELLNIRTRANFMVEPKEFVESEEWHIQVLSLLNGQFHSKTIPKPQIPNINTTNSATQ